QELLESVRVTADDPRPELVSPVGPDVRSAPMAPMRADLPSARAIRMASSPPAPASRRAASSSGRGAVLMLIVARPPLPPVWVATRAPIAVFAGPAPPSGKTAAPDTAAI